MNKWKAIIWFICVMIFSSVAVSAVNVTLNCDWYDNVCPNNSSIYLKMDNISTNYTNGHAQSADFTANNYTSLLCCNASTYDYLTPTGPTQSVFVRLWNETNSHIQEPSQSGYNYTGVFRTVSSYTSCVYTESSCQDGFQCIYSLAGDGASNRTNAHIARCGAYVNQVCCRITENVTVGGTADPPGTSGGVVVEQPGVVCAIGEVFYNGECVSMSDANCVWQFDKNRYEPNETMVFSFECEDLGGRSWTIDWMDSTSTVLNTVTGVVAAENEAEWMYHSELDGILSLQISDVLNTNQLYEIKEGYSIEEVFQNAGIWIVLFLVLVALGVSMIVYARKIQKKKRRIS